jgi:hypothetical protein
VLKNIPTHKDVNLVQLYSIEWVSKKDGYDIYRGIQINQDIEEDKDEFHFEKIKSKNNLKEEESEDESDSDSDSEVDSDTANHVKKYGYIYAMFLMILLILFVCYLVPNYDELRILVTEFTQSTRHFRVNSFLVSIIYFIKN